MCKTIERSDAGILVGRQQRALGRIQFGEERSGRPFKRLHTTEEERPFFRPYGKAEFADARRIALPFLQKLQDGACDAGTTMQRFDNLGRWDQVEDDIEGLLFHARQSSTGDAVGHVRQMLVAGNFDPGSAGVSFWADLLVRAISIMLLMLSARRSDRLRSV
jgi:hypothetical protein